MATEMQQDTNETEVLRQRVRDLELALGQRNESLAMAYQLSPMLQKLMGLLLSLPAVSSQMIVQRVGVTADAKVAIHRLRQHLKAHAGATKSDPITIHSRRGLGYWLDDETKARIKSAIQAAKGATEAVAPEAAAA